jgi:hypothetical protein
LFVFVSLDSHANVTVPMRNGVPREFDWLTPGVADLVGFIVEEPVPTVRGHEQKEAIMTDEVQVREASAFTASPLLARRRDAVLGDQLLIDRPRILSRRNATGHVEPVPMP